MLEAAVVLGIVRRSCERCCLLCPGRWGLQRNVTTRSRQLTGKDAHVDAFRVAVGGANPHLAGGATNTFQKRRRLFRIAIRQWTTQCLGTAKRAEDKKRLQLQRALPRCYAICAARSRHAGAWAWKLFAFWGSAVRLPQGAAASRIPVAQGNAAADALAPGRFNVQRRSHKTYRKVKASNLLGAVSK